MYTIDQRILVKTPGFALWGFISNFENNLQWHHDCTAISFLSQKRQGVATRWRQTTDNRLEMVFEILTWYDGLGFEYQFIDGHRYKACIGRVRLQEIAEGTLLQWTLQYELKGILGGVQNRLGMNSTIQNEMYVSLKSLAKLGNTIGSLENYAPKSLMKDGSLVPEERTFTTLEEIPSPTSVTPSFALETIASVEDTQPSRPVQLDDTLASGGVRSQPSVIPPTLDPRKDTAELSKVIPSHATVTAETSFMPTATTLSGSHSLEPSTNKDPNQLSIWEIFGIPNPNTDLVASKPVEKIVPPATPTIAVLSQADKAVIGLDQVRVGLRKMERTKQAGVRMATKKPS